MPTSNILQRITTILANKQIELDSSGDISRAELIGKLIPEYGWESIQPVLLEVLQDDSYSTEEYEIIATVFWGAVLDNRSIEANKVIALLYQRLPADSGSDRNNLAWSITCKLKNVDYLAEYKPMKDPGVIRAQKELGLQVEK